jgi:hypothetical protein
MSATSSTAWETHYGKSESFQEDNPHCLSPVKAGRVRGLSEDVSFSG